MLTTLKIFSTIIHVVLCQHVRPVLMCGSRYIQDYSNTKAERERDERSLDFRKAELRLSAAMFPLGVAGVLLKELQNVALELGGWGFPAHDPAVQLPVVVGAID